MIHGHAAYVVIARFDAATDNKLNKLRKRLHENGCLHTIPEWPPHITIAAYENINENLICGWTSEFVSKQKEKIEVALYSMSVLPPGGEHPDTAVLCLDPAHSKTFVDFYYSFHDKYEEYCTGIGWFNSIKHDNPIIHATIGIVQVKELQKAIELIISSGIFGKTEITALEVFTYPMKLIQRFELKSGGAL